MKFFWLLWGLLLVSCNLSPLPTPAAVPRNASQPHLVVAWVESGNLIVWQSGDTLPRRVASGGVIRPFVAPDGVTIAFTRGANGAADTLWTVDIDGTAEAELVGNNDRERTYRAGENQIGDVQWYDDKVLYFNTFQLNQPSFSPRNDLYRANVRTREVALILPTGEGGRFTFSPDKQHIALVSAGTYGEQNGKISVIDPLAQQSAVDLLYYVGVASGSHVPFYPSVFWYPDNARLLAVIPDKDLIYNDTETADNVPSTRLWQLPLDKPSDRALIGTVTASYFGLPTYNAFSDALFALQRIPKSNQFTLLVGDVTGQDLTPYVSQNIDQISTPIWLPNSAQFVYTLNQAGEVYLGERGKDPQRLSDEVIYQPLFVTATQYVFMTSVNNALEMRYATVGQPSQVIGTVTSLPIFDAVLVNPQP